MKQAALKLLTVAVEPITVAVYQHQGCSEPGHSGTHESIQQIIFVICYLFDRKKEP